MPISDYFRQLLEQQVRETERAQSDMGQAGQAGFQSLTYRGEHVDQAAQTAQADQETPEVGRALTIENINRAFEDLTYNLSPSLYSRRRSARTHIVRSTNRRKSITILATLDDF